MLPTMIRTTALGLALFAAVLLPAAGAQADEARPGRLILSVAGSASAVPDMATVSAGVVAEADSATAAMAGQRERMAKVVEAIRAAGIAERDIQTSSIDLSPIYVHDEKRGGPPRIAGYRAANSAVIIVRDLGRVGATLDALVEAGANDVGQISFGFSKEDELVERAREDAVKKLFERRDFYARTAGIKVSRILELSETERSRPPMPVAYAMRAEAKDASTPIAPGESEVSVNLSAVFAIAE